MANTEKMAVDVAEVKVVVVKAGPSPSRNAKARNWANLLMNVTFATVFQALQQIGVPKADSTMLAKYLVKVRLSQIASLLSLKTRITVRSLTFYQRALDAPAPAPLRL